MADYNGTLRKGLTYLYRHLPIKFQSPLTAFAPEAEDTYDCRPPAEGDLPPTFTLRGPRAAGYVKIAMTSRDSAGKVVRLTRYEALDQNGEYAFSPAAPAVYVDGDGMRMALSEWRITPKSGSAFTLAAGGTAALTESVDAEALYLPVVKYTLTVAGGSSADYCVYAGEMVSVTADAPAEGKRFAGWTGLPAGATGAESTTVSFEMPAADVDLAAVYADAEATSYVLTLTGGFCDGPATSVGVTAGTMVAVRAAAPADGKAFDAWTGDAALLADPKAADAVFAMPARDVSLSAAYRDADPALYLLTITQGDGSTSTSLRAAGEVVALSASVPSGYRFTGWSGYVANVARPLQPETTFTMPAQACALLVAKAAVADATLYPLTVVGGTGPASLLAGAVAYPVPDAPANGKQFAGWSGAVDFHSDTGDLKATSGVWFAMPAAALTITATYEDVPATLRTLTVCGSVVGSYPDGAVVGVSASGCPAPAGWQFANWSGDADHLANANSADTYIVIPGHDAVLSVVHRSIPRAQYKLTVMGGTGSGWYDDGSVVAIAALPAPAGSAFMAWTGDVAALANKSLAATTARVSAPGVSVAAALALAPKAVRTLTVTRMDGVSSALRGVYGDRIAVSAGSATGCRFAGWVGRTDRLADATASGTVFTMPDEDCALRATSVPVYDQPTQHQLTVFNGTGSGLYAPGELVHVDHDAPAAGKVFDKWLRSGCPAPRSPNGDPYATENLLLEMPGNDCWIKAAYKDAPATYFTVTVQGGYIAGLNAAAGRFLAGRPVAVSASVPAGWRFVQWLGADSGRLSAPTSPQAQFAMPAHDVCLTAQLALDTDAEYKLTVTGGTGSGSYKAGTAVAISADAPPAGKVFDRWAGRPCLESPRAAATVAHMPAADTELAATYKNQPETSFNLTVKHVYAGNPALNHSSAPADAAPGAAVALTADSTPGWLFACWSASKPGIVWSWAAASTHATMPSCDVVVEAWYARESAKVGARLVLSSATALRSDMDGDHIGDSFDLVADTPAASWLVFDKWLCDVPDALSSTALPRTTVTLRAPLTHVAAIYKETNYFCAGGNRAQSERGYMTRAQAGACEAIGTFTVDTQGYTERVGLSGWTAGTLAGVATLPIAPGPNSAGGAFTGWLVSGGGYLAPFTADPSTAFSVKSDFSVVAQYAPAYYSCFGGECAPSSTQTGFTTCSGETCLIHVRMVTDQGAWTQTFPADGDQPGGLVIAAPADPGPNQAGEAFKCWVATFA